MNKVLRAAIRTMSRHQGDMTKDYEKSRKKEKMYPYYKGRSCNTMGIAFSILRGVISCFVPTAMTEKWHHLFYFFMAAAL